MVIKYGKTAVASGSIFITQEEVLFKEESEAEDSDYDTLNQKSKID